MRERALRPASFEAVVLAAVAGAALGLLASQVASLLPGTFAVFAAALVPLYSRIERPDVLAHPTREALYETIRREPGIHAHALSRLLGVSWGTALHHLRLLEEHHLVLSEAAGRYRRFFVNSGDLRGKRQAIGVLRNDTSARVLAFVMANPGASQKDVCAGTGIAPSLATWHAGRLRDAGLLQKARDGRNVRYYPGELSEETARYFPPGCALTEAAA